MTSKQQNNLLPFALLRNIGTSEDRTDLHDLGEYPDCPNNKHGTGCHFADPSDEYAPCIYCGKPGGQ